ncbi:hypothetical protein WJX73_000490 [Symbiochloris irregularis]|uniref:Uncharacterized protein n=1 Tax=Symbiochloris irregularis TaxID=706552 RepID=A0AAW1NSV0_9CHLO
MQIDKFLEAEGDAGEQQALDVIENLRQAGKLRAFGNVRQIPKRLYSLEELRLNNIDATKFLSPSDDKLARIRTYCQFGLLSGITALSAIAQLQVTDTIVILFIAITIAVTDQVANGGGFEALALDAIARLVESEYGPRVAAHEAAHFLIAYLTGLLPRRYTLSSLDAWRRYGAFNVQAGTQFCDSAFQREVQGGKMSSSSLDRYSCVALAGVAEEYVKYGLAEGGKNDVMQLDSLLRALQFTQAKADGQIRWAVLNITSILRRHKDVHAKLAAAMSASKPVSECIAVIESGLADSDDI